MRSRGGNLASNPVLLGAVTMLVILVAMFLAYNANKGLPFVPSYPLRAEVPSGANLVVGNEVRIGGARVGAVSGIDVKTVGNGRNVAILDLKLDRAIQPLPEDSTLIVRPKSLLGQKYVEIGRGKSREGFDANATIPLSASRPAQVEFDQLVDTFDKETRDALAETTIGLGTVLAGRGESLNQAIGSLRPLLDDLVPVSQNLSSPATGLVNTIQALSRATAALAPVAAQQAELFVNAERTFAAIANQRAALAETLDETPATLDQGITTLRNVRPFLVNTTGLARELRPGVQALADTAPVLSDALDRAVPALRQTPALNRRLVRLLQSLQDFAEDPVVPRGVDDLSTTLTTLKPTLDFIAPAQLRCNYVGNLFENASDIFSVGDSSGNVQRFSIIATPQGPNAEGGPSTGPANGPTVENNLHSNPYPNTAAPGQPAECEAGNEPYIAGRSVVGNVPGTQQGFTDGAP